MTRQELFNKVAVHLLTQSQPSRNTDNDCQYRGPKGLKCAVGCLIPDDRYHLSFEGVGIGDFHVADPLQKAIYKAAGLRGAAQVRLADDLQNIHDNYQPEEWLDKLQTLAKQQGLSSVAVD